jgi:hypothetical protein
MAQGKRTAAIRVQRWANQPVNEKEAASSGGLAPD